ncbi:MAG TPA: DegT/DnrJ/EryC1/StrS family aminotransferase [Candidatus Sumerlaeota bacterium]|nr:DegT/DnrJ/EryC1/StrS family aminotransferase [Candidatus Sumerlaeota bacterium]HPS00266.1 DegT/DnrJ/EryC1/StrS family aminotransferase [Candidatus Sumerlaeota bacterium]
MKWIVPLSDVTVGEEEVAAASETLRSGWLTQGARVKAFEDAFAAMLGVPHALAVTNGTAALHLAYAAASLEPGDEYIVPALTFIATLNAGLYCGGVPVLADCVSTQDLTLSPEDVERKITPRTRLIVTMSYGGFCPDMPALLEIARKHNIDLVEDASHAPLAELDGRKIGTFGLSGTFSLFSNKNMTAGEGGVVVTRDDQVAEKVRVMRSHSMTTVTWDRHQGHAAEYDVTGLGFNYRFDELRASVASVQLRQLEQITQLRVQAAEGLRQAIAVLDIEGLEIPFQNPRGKPVHHLFVILLPAGTDRPAFRKALTEAGIQTSMHYPLLHRFSGTQPLFTRDPELPVVEGFIDRLVTLPMGPHLSPEKIELIAKSIGAYFGK